MIAYFDNDRTEWNMDSRIIEITPSEARREINQSVQEVHSIILQSGINPTLKWIPPAAIGGYVQNVNLIHDIFNLDGFFEIKPDHVLDMIDRAIGIYESNANRARFRIFNPFFYIGLVLDFISDLPFITLGKLGFNRQKARTSAVGRLVKGVLFLIPVFAALLTTLHHLGYLDLVKQFVHEFLGTENAN